MAAAAWLTFARFGVAAVVLLVAARSRIRAACTPAVLACGALGYGGSVLVQNAGITRTSVSRAALLIGAAPVLVAVIAAIWRRTVARPVAWAGFAVSLAGVGLVAGGPGGGATASGDGLVLASLLMSAMFTVAQTGLLRGRDPIAVTAVQFLAAALAVLPVAVATEGVPAVPSGAGTILAFAGLALGGTLLPFTLFAYGQSRCRPRSPGLSSTSSRSLARSLASSSSATRWACSRYLVARRSLLASRWAAVRYWLPGSAGLLPARPGSLSRLSRLSSRSSRPAAVTRSSRPAAVRATATAPAAAR